jgi:hypothetical protein
MCAGVLSDWSQRLVPRLLSLPTALQLTIHHSFGLRIVGAAGKDSDIGLGFYRKVFV